MWKINKWIFSKNCLTLFVAGREKKPAFSCTLSVLAKCFFWTKTVQRREHYKNRGFSGNCKTAKMTPFVWKRGFWTWLKKWVLLTVFLKSCVSWKHYFYSVFSKTQLFKTKTACWKKRKFMKNSGLLLNMAKWCFFGFVFWGFNIKRCAFGVSGIVSQVLKMLVFFPSFWAFLGWLIVVHLDLEGLGVFVFLVFGFLLCCCCFCFVCFVIGFVVGCCCFVFLCFVLFFLFVFWRV